MRIIEDLCPPAFLFLLYIAVHVGLDISLGLYLTAGVKVVTGIFQVFLLNAFCKIDLGVVSWVIISMPFLIMALATSIAMGLQMDQRMTSMMSEHFRGNKEYFTQDIMNFFKTGKFQHPEESNPI
jgi:hypothetical protein